jgi:hypothetical protein
LISVTPLLRKGSSIIVARRKRRYLLRERTIPVHHVP